MATETAECMLCHKMKDIDDMELIALTDGRYDACSRCRSLVRKYHRYLLATGQVKFEIVEA